MKIVIDLQACQSGSRFGGIGRYSIDLFKAMVRNHPHHQFIGLVNGLFPQAENEIRSTLRNIIPPSNIITFPAPSGCAPSRMRPELARTAEIVRECFINGLNPDHVHISSIVEGLHEDIISSIGNVEGGPPTTATFYDLIPLVERDTYLRDPLARSHYSQRIRMLERADGLLAISQFVADEGKRLLSNFSGRIVNINGGIDNKFVVRARSAEILSVRRKFGLNRKFVLYTASFDQRKNQIGLIRAFANLRPETRSEYQLAFAGGAGPETFASLLHAASDLGLSDNDVKFLGRVTDEELVTLYNCCHLFAFPSRSEGLGMPVLEAMACGAPVIGSNTSSIKEVVGLSKAMFDPDDIMSISSKLEAALLDRDYRSELIAHGRRHVEKYTWEKSAAIAVSTFETLGVERGAISTRNVVEILADEAHCEDFVTDDLDKVAEAAFATSLAQSKPWMSKQYKVGWVTSWGARCGIASYSKSLVQGLDAQPTILASYKKDGGFVDGANVFRCWDEGKDDYLIELFSEVQQRDLDAIHIQVNYGFFDFPSLKEFIEKCISHGISVFVTLHSTMDQTDAATFRLQYMIPAFRLCRLVFVHSAHDVSRLSSMGLVSNVKVIPVGVFDYGLPTRMPTDGIYTIATYGFALPGKGLVEIISAVADLRQRGINARLKMINASYEDTGNLSKNYIAEIKEAISTNDLDDYVQLDTLYHSDGAHPFLIGQVA